MANQTRVLLAGCGGISGVWVDAASKMPDVTFVGFVDINEDAAKRKRADAKADGAEVGTDLKAMIKLTKPEIVFDCSIPAAHAEITTTALGLGCHVLGEKPMADSLDNAKRMLAAAKQAKKTYAVMQNRRYLRPILAYQKLLNDGTLGQLHTLHSDFYIGAHFGGFRDHMKHVLILDMAIHTFDAARKISGANPVGVFCKEWNPVGSWYDHDASAVAMFEMSNGLMYTYNGSWCADGVGTSWEASWRGICTKGSATWDGGGTFHAERVEKVEGFCSPVAPVTIPDFPPLELEGHHGCIRDMVTCIQEGRTPQTVCDDNIQSVAMVFGAIESAETGKFVKINV